MYKVNRLASKYKQMNPYLSTMIQHLNNLHSTPYGDRPSFDWDCYAYHFSLQQYGALLKFVLTTHHQ